MDPVTIGVGVGWGISILGWLISPIISRLVNKGLDAAGSSAINLQNLEKNVLQLKLMLEAARVSPEAEKKLEPWLKRLKSAFYDAEDILDAIDYHRLYTKALLHHQSVNTGEQKATAKKDSMFSTRSKDNLTKTLQEIEKLIVEGEKLLPSLGLTTIGGSMKSSPEQTTGSLSKSSQTTSEPPKVFGRDEDIEKIRSMLRGTPADDHSVIGIHGIARSGKTTLAQYVCDCEKKSEDHHFELIMWIHVTKNFSVHTIYSEMLEIALGQKMDSFRNLNMLQSELKKSLKGKRLLLVLDDVWYSESVDKQDDLNKLLSPLKEADKGSRVLVTTRNADAAKFLGARNPMPISDMDEEEFFKMFMHYALDNSGVSDQGKGKFETIGKDIAALLGRLPLAAKTVAGQLKQRTSKAEDIEYWKNILIQKCDLLKDTMGALWWSYHQLEEHVRQCFAYCSMFPRRYELKRDELVKMWMAQGFVDTSNTSDKEVAARECFEVLLSTSFIQLKPKPDGQEFSHVQYYTVHDLLHDLAERVAGSDYFRIEKGMVNHQIPQDVRHLFIDSDNLGEFIEQIVKLDTLRTLVMSDHYQLTTKNFKRILKDLKKLRFVQVWLEIFEKNVIPECIGDLKHLRYLGLLAGTFIHGEAIDLRPAFTKLYHLQELSIPFAVRCLDSSHMADLENLRRISCPMVSIPDIGRMSWLQTLDNFEVKKEKGYEITQLEDLNYIHGELRIEGLGNIESKEDVRRANLSNKLHVSELDLDWEPVETKETGSSSRKKQKTAAGLHQQVVTPPKPEEILEALHPPALLEKLAIENYGGSTFPSWLSGEEDGKLKHLERLRFKNCHGSGSQLKFGKTLPGLHKLEIEWCTWNALPDNIEQLASLKELNICGCQNIQTLPGLPSSLKILTIKVCRNINTLPELPPCLEKLRIEDCQKIQLPSRLPLSLKELIIQNCTNISTLPQLPPSLEELRCPEDLKKSYLDRQAIDRIKKTFFY